MTQSKIDNRIKISEFVFLSVCLMPTQLIIIITVDYVRNITVCSLALEGLLCIQNMHSSKYFFI